MNSQIVLMCNTVVMLSIKIAGQSQHIREISDFSAFSLSTARLAAGNGNCSSGNGLLDRSQPFRRTACSISSPAARFRPGKAFCHIELLSNSVIRNFTGLCQYWFVITVALL